MAPEMTPEQRAEAQRILESLCLGPVRPYTTNTKRRKRDYNYLSTAELETQDTYAKLSKVRTALPEGLIAFLGSPLDAQIIVGAGNSQFDILRHAATAGYRAGHDTEGIICKLQEYDRLCGINIESATSSTVDFTLVNDPEDIVAFAQDLRDYCPREIHWFDLPHKFICLRLGHIPLEK